MTAKILQFRQKPAEPPMPSLAELAWRGSTLLHALLCSPQAIARERAAIEADLRERGLWVDPPDDSKPIVYPGSDDAEGSDEK